MRQLRPRIGLEEAVPWETKAKSESLSGRSPWWLQHEYLHSAQITHAAALVLGSNNDLPVG